MCAYSNFREDIKSDVDPFWTVMLACFSKIVTSDGAELDRQALQEDGENIGHEYNEEESEAKRSSSSHIGSIVTRVDVCHRNLICYLDMRAME